MMYFCLNISTRYITIAKITIFCQSFFISLTLTDIVNRQGNTAFSVNEITSKVEAMVGKTTDSAVRYVCSLMVQKGLLEQIHSDGRVLFGKKN